MANLSTTYVTNGPVNACKTVIGLRLGAGIEHFITQNISERIDYIFTYYGKVHTDIPKITGTSNTAVQGSLSYFDTDVRQTLYSHTILLNLRGNCKIKNSDEFSLQVSKFFI